MASAETSNFRRSDINCSILGRRSLGGRLPSGMTNSAAARLHSISSCQSSEAFAGPLRCRVCWATSENKVCAISWARENRTRSRGRVGLNSMRTPAPTATVRTSATSLFASRGIFRRSAIARGLYGGPDQPASRALSTSSRLRLDQGNRVPAVSKFQYRLVRPENSVRRHGRSSGVRVIRSIVPPITPGAPAGACPQLFLMLKRDWVGFRPITYGIERFQGLMGKVREKPPH
jgi:hypothetical protein